MTRLGLWHQQRADVQALLPLLATYLGHASYSDTAYYLTGSSDLLAIAAERAFLDGGAAGVSTPFWPRSWSPISDAD